MMKEHGRRMGNTSSRQDAPEPWPLDQGGRRPRCIRSSIYKYIEHDTNGQLLWVQARQAILPIPLFCPLRSDFPRNLLLASTWFCPLLRASFSFRHFYPADIHVISFTDVTIEMNGFGHLKRSASFSGVHLVGLVHRRIRISSI